MTEAYLQRFGGLVRLYGRAGLARLHAAHVCVVGLGGVGSWTVEGLARSGIGALTLVDLDDLCVTNVNRQLPALDGTIGRPKAAVLAERVKLINPCCRVVALTEFFTGQSAERILGAAASGRPGAASANAANEGPVERAHGDLGAGAEGCRPRFDCVVDAIDDVGNKARLVAACAARGLPVVTVGGAGGRSDPTQIRLGDLGEAWGDELLRQLRRKLRREHGFSAGMPKGRMHFGVRCVWSSEPRVFPWADGTCRHEPEEEREGREGEASGSRRLDCESGLGAAAFVTGSFGLAAAADAVRAIVGKAGES